MAASGSVGAQDGPDLVPDQRMALDGDAVGDAPRGHRLQPGVVGLALGALERAPIEGQCGVVEQAGELALIRFLGGRRVGGVQAEKVAAEQEGMARLGQMDGRARHGPAPSRPRPGPSASPCGTSRSAPGWRRAGVRPARCATAGSKPSSVSAVCIRSTRPACWPIWKWALRP